MAIAIDTSVLIAGERGVLVLSELLEKEAGPFYVPALAAAEFLAGTHLAGSEETRERARRFYESEIKSLVDVFDENDAAALGLLNANLRRKGRTMKLYDAAIAASALARGDSLLALDNDFDRVAGLKVLRP
jgi:predicted nucleic acid-binding protein